MGRIVIVAYKPKPGKAEELKQLTKTHVPRLRQEGLVTNREPIIMEATDGTVIEIFEWVDAAAIERAHQNKMVHQLWAEYAEVCDYLNLNSLAEAANMFAEFSAID
jgi:quinol monooxygenase YgiN